MRLRSLFYIIFILSIVVTTAVAATPPAGVQSPQQSLNPNLTLSARDDILNSLSARILTIKRDMLPPATPNPSYELAAAQDHLLRDYFIYADSLLQETLTAARTELDGSLAAKLAANTFNPIPAVEEERARTVQTYARKYEEGIRTFLTARMAEIEMLQHDASQLVKPGSDIFPLGLVAICGLILIIGLALALPGLVLGKVPQNRLRWLQGSLGVINLGILMTGYGLSALVIIAAVLGGLPNLVWYLGTMIVGLLLFLVARIIVSLIRSQHPEERSGESYTRTFSRDRDRDRDRDRGRDRDRDRDKDRDREHRERPPTVPEKPRSREFPRSRPPVEKPTPASISTTRPLPTPAPAAPVSAPAAPVAAPATAPRPKSRSRALPRPAPSPKPAISSDRRDTRPRSQKINLEGMDADQSATSRIVEALTPPIGFESELERLASAGEIPRSRDRGTITPPTITTEIPPATPVEPSAPATSAPVTEEAPAEIKPKRVRKPRKKAVVEEPAVESIETTSEPVVETTSPPESETTPAEVTNDFARIFGKSTNPTVDSAPVSQRPGRKRKKSFRR